MGLFSKKKKEPGSAKELLKRLKVERNAAALVLDPTTKKLDRQALKDSIWITKEKKKEIKTEFNKHKINPNKPAEDKSKPISDPARFKNLKFGKVYSGKTRKAKYTV
tara:strand:- start:11 stop:331 length:321 start_codon:yes stop_codon:yes gene_type:complete